MNTKLLYIEALKRRIAYQEACLFDSDWIPELPDEWGTEIVYPVSNTQNCGVHIPFNRQLYEVVKDFFINLGWTLHEDRTDEAQLGEYGFWPSLSFLPPGEKYTFEGKILTVSFDTNMKGSVCRRRYIGNATKEYAVYEFTCEGG